MTEAKGYPTTDRMSLSLAAINRAARIVVLVAGKAKQGIMKELGDSPKSDVAKWPVTGVQSPVWYVDSDAMAL
jgi:6-phosphogluconolactonase/glucosamine-6-phosphate isomerase/deaminase